MSDDFRMDMAEFNTLAADLGNLAKDTLPLVRTVVQKTAANIKRDAAAFAPVDTGNLRNSISYETSELAAAVTAEIGPTMGPAAYMGPAFDRHAGDFEKAIASIVDRLGQ
jgi:predicted TPR repeat methyltransferase